MTEKTAVELHLGNNVFFGIEGLGPQLGFDSLADFLQYIQGKTVVDVGSGYDGLALGANYYLGELLVISVNPTRNEDGFSRNRLSSALQWWQEQQYPPQFLSPDQLGAVEWLVADNLARIDALATCDMGHKISLPSDYADIIIDSFAASYYMIGKEFEGLFTETMREYLRVLKLGGEVLIADPSIFNPLGSWKQSVFSTMGIVWEPILVKNGREEMIEAGVRFTKSV